MSSWMNDAAVQNHNGAAFNHMDPNAGANMLDPSAYMPNGSSFDPAQFQNQQLQQRMQNGPMRNGSPAFNQPIYQTNPLIPSKRPRDDSLGRSPRQAAGMLPNSRSQTPQQGPYPGFQPNAMPQQQTPYSHLQNGSANASPSPIMANQLRPGAVPQRVSTASPHAYSPGSQQQFAPQPSPQSEHGGRIDTPTGMYAQNPGFAPQGFNPSFTPQPGRSSAPPQNAMSTPQMPNMPQQQQMYQQQQQPQSGQPRPTDQATMMYQMRLQQQLQQQQSVLAQRQGMPQNVNPLAKPPMQGPNGQYAGMAPRPQQPGQPGQQRPNNSDQFLKNLQAFMTQKGQVLDQNPMIGDRQFPIMALYMAVMKFGGYKKLTQQNMWGQVAQALGLQPMQHPNAGQQIKTAYEKNLLQFQEAWQHNQQQQRLQQQNAAGGAMPGAPPQMGANKPMNPGPQQQQLMMQRQQQLMAQQQQGQATPVKQMAPIQQPNVNGFSTPQQAHAQPQHPMSAGHVRNSFSRSIEPGTPQNGGPFSIASPGSTTKPSPQLDGARAGPPPIPQDFKLPDELVPKKRVLDTYGGVNVESLDRLGRELMEFKRSIPMVEELGLIDFHALTMSLQSGIHAEVRLALDHLAMCSIARGWSIDLKLCDDLLDSLIDCAETQVDLLAEHAPEVSDDMLITSYEDVVRGCKLEEEDLQDIPVYGTLEYDLDRAVEKLISITVILRNLSFYEPNKDFLKEDFVVKFICVVIRYLGTRNMLLRTNKNTLDFMKDTVTFLSNIAHEIELPGREQALCLLHLLLAFAPYSPSNVAGSDRVVFASYDPAVHRYLPAAVDSLAKLLARDEPNRTYYKLIFASDVASSPPYDLLTRTFGLAVSPIPDDEMEPKRGTVSLSVAEARKPFLMQGMLIAEILSGLVPGYESGVAKAWLLSDDGFARNLSRLILSLCLETSQQHPQRVQPPQRGLEDEALLHIAMGGIAVLRRLAEKSRSPDDKSSVKPLPGMPAKELLLRALEVRLPRMGGVLKQLCAYSGLDT